MNYLNEETTGLDLEVYPNPFDNEFLAKINSAQRGAINIRMVDILGKEILNQNYDVSKGINTLEFSNLIGLNTGVYQIFVIDDQGNHEIQKVVYQPK